MKCLAVNTATSLLSVALVDGDNVLHLFESPETRNQGNLVITHMRAAVHDNGLKFQDLDLIAAVTGPGSFTGIRIGLAAARGVSMAAGVPATGVNSFDLFAEEGADLVAIESWRDELYFRLAGQEPVNLSPEDFIRTLKNTHLTVAGDAADKVLPLLRGAKKAEGTANAVTAATIAIRQKDRAAPSPFYLRDADISQPKGK